MSLRDTTDNTAASAFRGMLSRDLLACLKHIAGPEFLRQEDTFWTSDGADGYHGTWGRFTGGENDNTCVLHIQEEEDP
ncbi:Hypothetical protein CINCED_3A017603 [Cinara cedri]|uniref:Uncharacterized protein n=1 Tax=Cinara cedri TaxID=506608 RepID=A0A5E4N869_9HEMI|nr:Hypothetical protein CINCED_3A017603 [Cinara cedri]